MKLREKQKLERQMRILDNAERLIRETGNTDFSVRTLAAAANVSPATPFNLFGSKESILYTLLLRSLDTFETKGLIFLDSDPCYHVIEAAENAANIFVSDSEFLRPLYKVLLSVSHPEHRPGFMARTYSYWKVAADTIPANSKLRDNDLSRNIIAYALMAHFTGLMEMWIHGDLTDDDFKYRAIFAAIMDIYMFLKKPDQDKLFNQFKEISIAINDE